MGSVAWNSARALDKPGLDIVSRRPAMVVACAYDMGCVTDGRAAVGVGLWGKKMVAVGSVCVMESVLVTVVVCEVVLMVATSVCVVEQVMVGAVWMAILVVVVGMVWVDTKEVGIGVVRSWISVWSCQLEVLASSSRRVSRVMCDVAVKEEVVAD